MDVDKFKEAIRRVYDENAEKSGIGTLSEKTTHSILKLYFAEDFKNQEIKIFSYYADVFHNQCIYEIQTRNFNKLRNKLNAFLKLYPVNVVFPINEIKWIIQLDDATLGQKSKRKSPKKGSIYEIMKELYRISDLLTNPNLHFILVMMEVEELRLKNDTLNHVRKVDRFPLALLHEIHLSTLKDYLIFVPFEEKEIFTSLDLKKKAHISASTAQLTLLILSKLKVVERIGKKGNSFLYQISTSI